MQQRQIASLTKIMTALVVLDLVEKFKISSHCELDSPIKILRPASDM
jgi:D-alanyl-D-alanine carboxypeptidase